MLAKERGIGGGAVLVLNKTNISYLEEIYDFFHEEEINFKINPLIETGRALENSHLAITPEEYSKAMIFCLINGIITILQKQKYLLLEKL